MGKNWKKANRADILKVSVIGCLIGMKETRYSMSSW